MKAYTTNPSIFDVSLVKKVIVSVIVIVTALVCCSCGSTKMVIQTVRDVSVDTIYLSNIQYDSIYIYRDHVSEHHLGTLPPNLSTDQYMPILQYTFIYLLAGVFYARKKIGMLVRKMLMHLGVCSKLVAEGYEVLISCGEHSRTTLRCPYIIYFSS